MRAKTEPIFSSKNLKAAFENVFRRRRTAVKVIFIIRQKTLLSCF